MRAIHFQNPVYKRSFPDPFVLKYCGEYFAFCTGLGDNGRVFGVLTSRNLVNWMPLTGAMRPLHVDHPHYWAPEVTHHNGKFYLYYSVGNETLMEIRVAVSDTPEGEYIDSGHKLTVQDFAIDPHVFRDDDGQWYMFYATDFLESSHIGTGTVVDRMLDPFTLAGEPLPAVRAKYHWQVYDSARAEKGGVRWHTVEGPFVLKRKGVYYEMFSGGNWQNVSYGVSFATSHGIESKVEWDQFSDGEKILPIMRTVPGEVIGPGHNSVVTGPNGRELYCVYHEWSDGERVLAVDRMDFAGGDRLFVLGPSNTPQTPPYPPTFFDPFEKLDADTWTRRSGQWRADASCLAAAPDRAEIGCSIRSDSFLCSVWARATAKSGEYGVGLRSNDGESATILISADGPALVAYTADFRTIEVELPKAFDPLVFHEIAISFDRGQLDVRVDGIDAGLRAEIDFRVSEICLITTTAEAVFAAFAVTHGFEELFVSAGLDRRGWRLAEGGGNVAVADGNLVLTAAGGSSAIVSKDVPDGDFELVVNLLLVGPFVENAYVDVSAGPIFRFFKSTDDWIVSAAGREIRLPSEFSAQRFQQFRFIREGGKICVDLENHRIGEVRSQPVDSIGLSITGGTALVDMIRFTAL